MASGARLTVRQKASKRLIPPTKFLEITPRPACRTTRPERKSNAALQLREKCRVFVQILPWSGRQSNEALPALLLLDLRQPGGPAPHLAPAGPHRNRRQLRQGLPRRLNE